MNFNKILFCTALLALPFGCRKSAIEEQVKGEVPGDGLEVFVKDILTEDGTKAYLTADREIAWSEGDEVLVIGKNNASATMSVVPLGTDATHGFLSGDIPAPATTGKPYTAYYPAGIFDAASTATEGKGTLPETYSFAESQKNPLKCLPLYAQSTAKDGKVLEFRSAFGLLQMNIRGTMSVTKVEVSASDTLSGEFSINPETGAVAFTGTGKKKMAIDCGAAGVALNGNDGLSFFLPIAPAKYDSIKVKIYTREMNESGGICEYVSTDVTIKKGTVHRSTFKAERDAVQLWPGGPYWATTNIGATNDPSDAASWYGNYYMWGFTTDPATWDWTEYSAFDGDDTGANFSKYMFPGSILSENDDAARRLWGGDWEMPTAWDIKDLFDRCDNAWTADYEGTGVSGLLFTNRTDDTKKVFFPAAGKGEGSTVSGVSTTGNYWTATLKEGKESCFLTFDSGEVNVYEYAERCVGMTVRPIKGGGRATGVPPTPLGLTFDPLTDGGSY